MTEFVSGFGQYHSDRNGTNPRPYVTCDWKAFEAMLEAPHSTAKEQSQWVIFSTLFSRNADEQRTDGQFHALWADIDDAQGLTIAQTAAKAKAALGDVSLYCYSSRSATEANQKARIVVPLADLVCGQDFELMQCVLNDRLEAAGLMPDRATERANQVMYLPNRGEHYAFERVVGSPVNAAAEFASEVNAIKQRQHQRQIELDAARERSRLKAASSMVAGCSSPVGAFNQAYDLETMLNTFGYRKRGNRYLSPLSESGVAGVTVSDNRWISQHGSDIAAGLGRESNGTCSGDAFDLFVYFEHGGDYSAAIKAAGAMFTTENGKTITAANQQIYMQGQEFVVPVADRVAAANDEKAPCTRLVEVPLGAVMSAEPEPVRFAIEPWFPARNLTLFGGHGGIGKSSFCLAAAAHVACGKPFAGLPVTQSRVLFVSLEDEPSIVKTRLRHVIDAYNLPPDLVLSNMRLLDGTRNFSALMVEGEHAGAAPVFTLAFWQLVESIKDAGLVVIDNASDAFDANENARREVRAFIRGLIEHVGRKHDAAVVLLAHIDKQAARGSAQGNSYSGSTAWHNSARSRLAMTDKDGFISVVHEKANLSAKAEPVSVEFKHGLPMPSGAGAGSDGITQAMFDQASIVRVLEVAHEADITVPAAMAGPNTTFHVLETFTEYPSELKRGKAGRARARAALTALKRVGRVSVESYQGSGRNTRERLVLAHLADQLCAAALVSTG